MKRFFLLLAIIFTVTGLMADDYLQAGQLAQPIYVQSSEPAHRDPMRPVPVWSYNNTPSDLLTSWYDYMIGGYNSIPLYLLPDSDGGGYMGTFHGKRTQSGLRRVFYTHIGSTGSIINMNEITNAQIAEGYPGMDFDPVAGKPIYAWHAAVDADTPQEVQYASDAFLMGISGLLTDPVLLINNPTNYTNTAGTVFTNGEFIWPTVCTGPSPTAGMRRVYVLTRNTVYTTTGPCENAYIAYADFNATMIEAGTPLTWTYTFIPEQNDWNSDTSNYRRPFDSLVVGTNGCIYYIGYHTASNSAGTVINEADFDVFVNTNYGAGAWTRYSTFSNTYSWNPTTQSGANYFTTDVTWRITNAGHLNAMLDETNGVVHCIGLWHLTPADGASYYQQFNSIKEVLFNTTNHSFSFSEIYPQAGTAADTLYWQPWDTNGDHVVDGYDTSGNPTLVTDWNYPHWDETGHGGAMQFHYNLMRITEPNALGWMAAVWENSWKAKRYNQNGDTQYAAYANTPEIFISITNDYGVHWSQPIQISSVTSTPFANNLPMWVYPADQIKNMGLINGQPVGKLGIMYYHDNSWGAYPVSTPYGSDLGGIVKFMSLNIEFSNLLPAGINGNVTRASDNQPVSGATVTCGTNTATTNAAGAYNMDVTPGTYSVTVSALGYQTQTQNNVLITSGNVTTVNFSLVSSPTVTVSGTVQGDSPPVFLADATINLTGVLNYSGTTNAIGYFGIPNVLGGQTYQYTVSHAGFENATGSITVGTANYNMGIIILNELALPPTQLLGTIQTGNDNVVLTWLSPQTRNGLSGSRTQPGRSITGYYIWRFIAGQENTPNLWTQLGSVSGTTLTYNDTGWALLDVGSYRYAVKAQYNNNNFSSAALSNILVRAVYGVAMGFVRDLDNVNIVGAVVTLTRLVPNGQGPYIANTNALGQFYLGNVWYGDYSMSCSAPSYQTYTQSPVTVNFNDVNNYNLQLTDVLAVPQTVQAVETNPNLCTITWAMPVADGGRSLHGFQIWRFLAALVNQPDDWVLLSDAVAGLSYADAGWQDLPSGMYQYAVKAKYSGNLLSEAGLSNEIFKEVANDDPSQTPSFTGLLGCQPNPLATHTTIRYAVQKASAVSIGIYNSKGQLVCSLANGVQARGIHTLQWNGTNNSGMNLPAGIYFCRMQSGSQHSQLKLVLMK